MAKLNNLIWRRNKIETLMIQFEDTSEWLKKMGLKTEPIKLHSVELERV